MCREPSRNQSPRNASGHRDNFPSSAIAAIVDHHTFGFFRLFPKSSFAPSVPEVFWINAQECPGCTVRNAQLIPHQSSTTRIGRFKAPHMRWLFIFRSMRRLSGAPSGDHHQFSPQFPLYDSQELFASSTFTRARLLIGISLMDRLFFIRQTF